MEEKKRRPRIKTPQGSGFSLKERPKLYLPGDEPENQDEPSEHTSPENNEGSERRPSDRDSGNDRGGYDRPRYQDRDRGEGGGGGYERRPYDRDRNSGDRSGYDRPRYQDRDRGEGGGGGYERRPYDRDRNSGGGDRGGYDRPRYQDRDRGEGGGGGYERRPYDRDRNSGGGDRGGYDRPRYQDRGEGGGGGYERRPYDRDRNSGGGDRPRYQDRGPGGDDRPRYQDRGPGGGGYERRPYDRDRGGYGGGQRGYDKPYGKKPFGKKPFGKKEEFHVERKPKATLPTGEGMPLNKYLAHCGISSRRKAVDFIEQGLVTVNGEVKTEPYYRIQAGDVVTCEGQTVSIQERLVYILLNKPKGVITTTDDEHGRATVLDIVDPHFPERIYPVGRLDRDTTGLLLITNDGELAQKLSHPSYTIHKQYRAGLDRPLSAADFKRIEEGVELEDGLVTVNWIRFSEDHPTRDVVELEIVVGRNRVVRRLFEHLGYRVRKLDRFYYAGLTKKDLPRGAFRELTQREIIMLKHFTGHPSAGLKRPDATEEAAGDDDDASEETDEL